MKFAEPIWLAVGLLVAVGLIVLYLWLARRRERELRRFAAERLIPRLTRGVSVGRRRLKATLFILGVSCLFVALARPQWGVRREEVRMQGIDILIALDTSKSMLATDVTPNRLDRAKLAIHDFVSTLGAARIGLIPFAGDAFLLCPLTLDRDAFEVSLDDLDTHIVPEGGTDIARAIRTAEKVLEKGANQKILVLITDGEDLEGGAIKAAKEAAKKGITIYTVGVGTQSGNLIVLDNGRPLVGPDGKAVRSRLDEKTLRKIASITGGMYAPLVGKVAGLETIRRERLSKIAKSELESQTKEIPIERYQWPLGLGLLLLALEFCIGSALRRKTVAAKSAPAQPKRPRPVIPRKKSSAAAATATALFAVALVPHLRAAEKNAPEPPSDPRHVYNEGTELWQKKNFAEAEQKFHDALNTGDLSLQNRAYYNMGNARYRLGQAALTGQKKDVEKTMKLWQEAIKAYDAALKLNPNDEDARFNKDFVKRKLEELKQQQKKNQQKNQQQQKQQKDQKQKNQNKKDQNQKNQKQNKDKKNKQNSENQKNQQNQKNNENKEKSGKQKNQDQKKNSENKQNQSGKQSDQKNKDRQNQSGSEKKQDQQKDKGKSGDEQNKQKQEKGKDKKDQKPEQKPEQKKQQNQPGQTGEEKQNAKPGQGQAKVDQYANPSKEQRIPGQMTKEEAKRLLESLTNEEGKLRIAVPRRTRQGRSRSNTPKRDW